MSKWVVTYGGVFGTRRVAFESRRRAVQWARQVGVFNIAKIERITA